MARQPRSSCLLQQVDLLHAASAPDLLLEQLLLLQPALGDQLHRILGVRQTGGLGDLADVRLDLAGTWSRYIPMVSSCTSPKYSPSSRKRLGSPCEMPGPGSTILGESQGGTNGRVSGVLDAGTSARTGRALARSSGLPQQEETLRAAGRDLARKESACSRPRSAPWTCWRRQSLPAGDARGRAAAHRLGLAGQRRAARAGRPPPGVRQHPAAHRRAAPAVRGRRPACRGTWPSAGKRGSAAAPCTAPPRCSRSRSATRGSAAEEQAKRLREATIFLTGGFVHINRTVAVPGAGHARAVLGAQPGTYLAREERALARRPCAPCWRTITCCWSRACCRAGACAWGASGRCI